MQSLESIPTWFSDFFDISLEAGQVFLSIVVIVTILLPVMIATKGKANTVYIMTFILIECLLVGIGWLNVWVIIATLAVLSLGFAKFGSDLVAGG